jgi:hypothetical protein
MLESIILSYPSLIHLDAPSSDTAGPRSWIQLARTGSFVSKRYGKFAITKDDLSQMSVNFRDITPKSPTELPIDYDHLSMDPKKPGDGIAAGWLKKVELRENGEELWGQVEWTPDAAERIEKKEYRFVSPSFIKDHTHKNGQKIGTTLLAAAITNHPFLEGMQALTLFNFSAMGDLALGDFPPTLTTATLHLAAVGQHVGFKDDASVIPELSDDERSQTYQVKAVIGDGDDQFVRLTTSDGATQIGWFRADQLAPADAQRKQEDGPMPDQKKEIQTMSDINTAAARFERRVNELFTGGRTLRDALDLAQVQDEEGAEAYRLAGLGSEMTPEHAPIVSLSSRTGEGFDQLAERYAVENRVSLREAIHAVGVARPDLAEAR